LRRWGNCYSRGIIAEEEFVPKLKKLDREEKEKKAK